MLTKTSEIAIKVLVYLGEQGHPKPLSPRLIGDALGESQTYLAKIAGLLTKAGILRSHRGTSGGIELALAPQDILLLDIVQACQGVLLPDYCAETDDLRSVCSFHRAMSELHSAIVEVLSRWTLADLLQRTCPLNSGVGNVDCKIGVRREPTVAIRL